MYSVSDDGKRSLESNFKNYWKFIWRIGVYLIIALLFYFLNILYLYKSCTSLLHLRPSLLRDVINTLVSYKALIVWSSEMTVVNAPQSLTVLLAESYPFTNLEAKFNEAFQSATYSVKQIRDKKYSPLLSHDFMAIFYEKVPDSILSLSEQNN
ncbi:unnamed protein product [Blepharisma stoltei]|uniref:ATP synthase F0 subunit 8 n=1 Tax=Blepharisma stoltei TaxID=1481888 RepID=A0AAU9JFM7_9CILI|nr:unnamed protein product [Blepharisma stoltei]